MNPIEQLKTVLCDHTGKCSIIGSDEDREIVDQALQALAAPVQEPVTDNRVDLIADNIDPGDWNSPYYQDCWHDGFKAGFREAEKEHNIKENT
jgi:hypothetical protein